MPKKPKRYRVTLKRKGAKSKTVHTHARSAKQAKRFGHFRKPGYSATSARRD